MKTLRLASLTKCAIVAFTILVNIYRVRSFAHRSLLQTFRNNNRGFATVRYASLFRSILPSNSLADKRDIAQMATFDGGKNSEVIIEAPSMNSRRITSSILIDGEIDDVWNTLTDYNNLATYIPNLTQSYKVSSPPNTVRIFQEGAQKIIGFDFRAALTMDMNENQDYDNDSRASKMKVLKFTLADSQMFSQFDGEWVLRTYSRSRVFDATTKTYYYRYKTQLTYSVFIRPKGPVPVIALEWRIKEDVPTNLIAMKAAVETRVRQAMSSGQGRDREPVTSVNVAKMMDWAADETLGAYIKASAK